MKVMPKLSEKIIKNRNKIYEENHNFLGMLFAVYEGNFVQLQAKELALEFGHGKTVNGKFIPYTDSILNKLFKSLEDLKLIDRKKYRDTNSLCVSFKKPLICMILNIDNQDSISINKNGMNKSTNEIFDSSLFKGYIFKMFFKKITKFNISNMDYSSLNDILKKFYFTAYITDSDISNFYKKYDGDNFLQYVNQKINNIEKVRNMRGDNEKYKLEKERKRILYKGDLFINSYDLITLKRRKIYYLEYKKGEIVYRELYICVSTDNYTYDKLYNNIGEAIASLTNTLRDLKDKYILTVNVIFYNKDREKRLYKDFTKLRNIYDKYNKLSHAELIKNKYSTSNSPIIFNFINSNLSKYRGEGVILYERNPQKETKPKKQTKEETYNQKINELQNKLDSIQKLLEEIKKE